MGLSRLAVVVTAVVGSVDGVRLESESCGVIGSTRSSNVHMSIENGKRAPECAWKWQVGLIDSGFSKKPFCGGMLIGKEWVLTAASCIRWSFSVVAGEYKPNQVSGNEQIKAAVNVIRHPQHDFKYQGRATYSWDLALVRLESPMEFNNCVGSVCLPEEGADVADGTECWITGWGRVEKDGRGSDVLQEGKVNIVSNADCMNRSKSGYSTKYNTSVIDESMLCAKGHGWFGRVTDACKEDRGGPLVCGSGGTWSVYGVASWGEGCAGENYPGVWARVAAARAWIDATLADPPKPLCPEFAEAAWPDSSGNCKCKDRFVCSTNGGQDANCPNRWREYFGAPCEECKCVVYQGPSCPVFAEHVVPEKNGECLCKHDMVCSTNGKDKNCPTARGGVAGLLGNEFLQTCEDCKCIDKWLV